MALFSSGGGGHSASAHGHHAASSNLVEFRAGKLNLRDANMVHPDKRKGLLYIHQSDDMLMHFCWKDRNSGTVEEDLIIFPDDTEFLKVKECTTGRVFLLKFKSTSRKLFFWMQEPKTEKDDELCKKVNDTLNNPPVAGSNRAATGGGGRGAARAAQSGGGSISDQLSAMNQALGLGASEQELSALAGMDQQQLMQFFNLVGGGGGGLDAATLGSLGLGGSPGTGGAGIGSPAITSTPTIPTPAASRPTTGQATSGTGQTGGSATPASVANAIQLSDLQSILAGMNIPAEAAHGPPVDLDEVLSNQRVSEVAAAEGNAARLLPHLPNDQPVAQDREELARTVRSPQFRQAAGMFGSALQTGQLGPLMRQFGLGDGSVDAASRGDIQSFAELLEQEENPEPTRNPGSGPSEPESKPADKPDKQDGMDLD